MKRISMLIVVGLFILITSSSAFAATVSSTFNVTATIASVCSIASATNLNFGAYDPTLAANNDAGASTVTVRCTKDTQYELYISPGAAGRAMVGAPVADSLNYELYTDAARLTAFPSSAVGPKVNATDANLDIVTTVYGRIPALQNVSWGNYSQTVTVVVDYL